MPFLYKDTEYEIKPLTLGVKAAVIDIFEERNRLIREIESNIDLQRIIKSRQSLDKLKDKAQQKKELGDNTDAINEQIEKLIQSQESDTKLQAEIRYYEAQLQTVIMKLVYNVDLMRKIIPVIVDKPIQLDFEDLQTESFILQVLQDFFFKIGLSSSK